MLHWSHKSQVECPCHPERLHVLWYCALTANYSFSCSWNFKVFLDVKFVQFTLVCFELNTQYTLFCDTQHNRLYIDCALAPWELASRLVMTSSRAFRTSGHFRITVPAIRESCSIQSTSRHISSQLTCDRWTDTWDTADSVGQMGKGSQPNDTVHTKTLY